MERKRSSTSWFTLQRATMGDNWSQLMCWSQKHPLVSRMGSSDPSTWAIIFHCLPRPLVGTGTGSRAVGTWSSTHMECLCSTGQLNPLYHNASLYYWLFPEPQSKSFNCLIFPAKNIALICPIYRVAGWSNHNPHFGISSLLEYAKTL